MNHVNRTRAPSPDAAFAAAVLTAGLALSACTGGDGEATGQWGGTRDTIAGVEVVTNPVLRLDFLPFGMRATGDGRLMLTGLQGGSGITRLLDLDGTITPYEPPDSSRIVDGVDYDGCPRWGTGPDGLLRALCRRLLFQQLSVAEGLKREVLVERPPILATEAELGEMESQLRRMVAEANLPAGQAERFVEERLEEARVKAVFAGIRGDAATGRVYVLEQTPPVLGGGPASLNVFDSTGRYLARLAFDRRWVYFRVRADRVFALTEDPGTGVRSLTAYDLDWPDAGAREP